MPWSKNQSLTRSWEDGKLIMRSIISNSNELCKFYEDKEEAEKIFEYYITRDQVLALARMEDPEKRLLILLRLLKMNATMIVSADEVTALPLENSPELDQNNENSDYKDKLKSMFDSNAFDKLIAEKEDLPDIYNKTKGVCEYYVTTVQVEELNNIPDTFVEKREKIFCALFELKVKMLYEPAILGRSRLGYCVLANSDTGDTIQDLSNGSVSRLNDALIGAVTKQENCMIITDDAKFIKRLDAANIPNTKYENWRKMASFIRKTIS